MEKFSGVLAQLAERLGQTAESLWPHAVRYVVVDAATALLGALVVLVVSAYALAKCVARIKPALQAEAADKRRPYEQPFITDSSLFLVAAAVLSIPILIAGGIALTSLDRIIEPIGYLVSKAIGAA